MNPSDYTAAYDADYYAHGCGTPYRRDEAWLGFFATVADRIVEGLGPGSVLDVGCAMGFLVEPLLARGVDAWGFDVSDFAIGQVPPPADARCRVGRLGGPLPADFPGRYDLVTCIEVLEHLPPAEAPAAIAALTGLADDVLFSSTPLDHQEPTHLNVQPTDYWAGLFAAQGFFRDLDFEARFLTPWAMRFRRGPAAPRAADLVRGYERRLARLEEEVDARRLLAGELRGQLAERDRDALAQQAELAAARSALDEADLGLLQARRELGNLADQLAAWMGRWAALEGSPGYALLSRLQGARLRFLPAGSHRERAFDTLLGWRRIAGAAGVPALGAHVWREGRDQGTYRWRQWRRRRGGRAHERLTVAPIPGARAVPPRATPLDIVVCVHDALAETQACLASVRARLEAGDRLILVDDGSGPETAGWVRGVAAELGERASLIRHDSALGYTRAANAGLRAARADWVLLLNSDTVLAGAALDRLLAAATSAPRVGLAGPLSNAATYQSVPEPREGDAWAVHELPAGLDLEAWAELIAQDSVQLRPAMPFLNGFCLLVSAAMLREVGLLDEATFGQGYGEENDLAIRARAAGWSLVLADDAYVQHAMSASYRHERRRALEARAGEALAAKHGTAGLLEAEGYLRHDRVLQGIRSRARVLADRHRIVEGGGRRFGGRRVLCVMPLAAAGGGASIAMFALRAMRRMGVEVAVFNLAVHRHAFEAAYPDLDLPVIYGQEEDLVSLAGEWDALMATMYTTVAWLDRAARGPHGARAVFGYFIQDLEAYFYPPGSERFHAALASYRLMPGLRMFAMTPWNAAELGRLFGLEVPAVMPAYDADLFRPHPRRREALPGGGRPGAVRILGMIRPATPFRGPALTMEVFREMTRRHGPGVEVILFGVEPQDAGWEDLPRDFPFHLAGKLEPRQVASLMNEVDIFCDFSTWQAMGMTAMEAMLCGVATVVTRWGGPGVYARDGANCLMVDPHDRNACVAAVDRLVRDAELRRALGEEALRDVSLFYPERAAWNMLNALFGPEIDAAMARSAREERRLALEREGQA